MATSIDNIVLVFTARGVTRVQANIAKVGASASTTTKSVNLMRGALGGLGAVLAVRQIVQYTDAYTELQNKMRLVNDTSEKVENATQDIFDIASRTRGNLEETTRTYFRFARANERLGLSERELLQITETINQAVAFSGTSAESAASALFQFSQGIAAGTLRGQELNAVLEQVPGLAEVLARGLKIGVDQLRAMGAAGELTGKQLTKAILSQKEFAQTNFDQIVFTISQEMERLRTNIVQYVGELNKATGFSRVFTEAIRFVADNLDLMAKGLLVVVALMAQAFAPSVVRSIRAVTIALAANPLGALLVGLSAAVTAMTIFREDIVLIEESGATLGTVMEVAFEKISVGAKAAFETAKTKAGEFFESLTGTTVEAAFISLGNTAATGLNGVLDVIRQFANPAIGLLTLAPRLMIEAFSTLPRAIGDLIFRTLETMRQVIVGQFNFEQFFTNIKNFIIESFKSAFDFIVEAGSNAFQALKDLTFDFTLPDLPDVKGLLADPIVNQFEGGLQAFFTGMDKVVRETLTRDFVGDATAAFAQIKANFIDPFFAAVAEAQAVKDALKKPDVTRVPSEEKPDVPFRVDPKMIEAVEKLTKKFTPLNDKLRDNLILLQLMREQVVKYSDQFKVTIDQVDAAIKELEGRIAGTVELQTELWIGAAEAIRTALVDVLIDPFNASLRDLAAGFVATMQKIVAEAIAAQAVLATLNFLQGFTSFRIPGATALPPGSTLPGSQFGQTAIAGKPRLVGESGPEILIPASRSRFITNEDLTSGGKGTRQMAAQLARLANAVLNMPPPEVLNINEQDPAALLSTLNTQKGTRVQTNFIQVNQRQVKRDLGVR